MNLTPQQKEAVNRKVFEVTHPGECWHEYSYVTGQGLGTSCTKCDRIRVRNPDYWHDANACLEALGNMNAGPWTLLHWTIGFPFSFSLSIGSRSFTATGATAIEAIVNAILATVGESVESVIAKAGKTNG